MMKTCQECGVALNSERKKFCSNCLKEHRKQYYEKNKEIFRERSRNWRKKNQEAWRNIQDNWRKRNLKKHRENVYKYRKQGSHENNKKYSEKYLNQYKEYRKENPEIFKKIELKRKFKYTFGRKWKEQCINCNERLNDFCKLTVKKIKYLTKKECKKTHNE